MKINDTAYVLYDGYICKSVIIDMIENYGTIYRVQFYNNDGYLVNTFYDADSIFQTPEELTADLLKIYYL